MCACMRACVCAHTCIYACMGACAHSKHCHQQTPELLPKGIVEGDGVDHIAVPFKGVELLSGRSVPDFARPIIAARDEAANKTLSVRHSP